MGEADFASYLLARWPALVRTLVLLGVAPAEADGLARDALARCHPGFDRARREGDVDVHVYRQLLATWRQGDAGGVGSGYHPVGDAAVPDPTVPDPEARVALLASLQQALSALPVEQRLVVVLRYAAELDDEQVADVLELPREELAARQAAGLARLDAPALLREHL